ncbi:MAG: hypothetical protein HQ596_02850 [Candidatus Saganbacteria bacterium]|nr:hypothetical protein [Candidatus Saganbacteria bacterium]
MAPIFYFGVTNPLRSVRAQGKQPYQLKRTFVALDRTMLRILLTAIPATIRCGIEVGTGVKIPKGMLKQALRNITLDAPLADVEVGSPDRFLEITEIPTTLRELLKVMETTVRFAGKDDGKLEGHEIRSGGLYLYFAGERFSGKKRKVTVVLEATPDGQIALRFSVGRFIAGSEDYIHARILLPGLTRADKVVSPALAS